MAKIVEQWKKEKHKGLVIVICFIVFFGSGLTVWLGVTDNEFIFARYSLVIEIIVGLMLGLFFWYLQKIDNDKTQELETLQNTIVEEVRMYVAQQKEIQDSIREASLKVIQRQLQSAMRNILFTIGRIEAFPKNDLNERAKRLDDSLKRIRFESYANTIDQQLSQVAPYIHREFTDEVSYISSDLRLLSFQINDKNEKRLFDVDKPETVENWLRYAKSVYHAIKEVNKTIEDYHASEDKPVS